MTDESTVVQQCQECITLLQKEFSESTDDCDSELDLHFVLYHLLCQHMPELFQLATYYEPDGTEFKGRRIYVEYETHGDYKGRSGQNGRYDVAIFGDQQQLQEDDPPLVAIELKVDWEPRGDHFLNDFTKLSNPAIRYPYFIYCDSDPYSPRYYEVFRQLKKTYPRVNIHYLSKDREVTL